MLIVRVSGGMANISISRYVTLRVLYTSH